MNHALAKGNRAGNLADDLAENRDDRRLHRVHAGSELQALGHFDIAKPIEQWDFDAIEGLNHLRCYFMKDGHIAGVEFLDATDDQALIDEARKLFEASARGRGADGSTYPVQSASCARSITP